MKLIELCVIQATLGVININVPIEMPSPSGTALTGEIKSAIMVIQEIGITVVSYP